jgi:hypothetical protein
MGTKATRENSSDCFGSARDARNFSGLAESKRHLPKCPHVVALFNLCALGHHPSVTVSIKSTGCIS